MNDTGYRPWLPGCEPPAAPVRPALKAGGSGSWMLPDSVTLAKRKGRKSPMFRQMMKPAARQGKAFLGNVWNASQSLEQELRLKDEPGQHCRARKSHYVP